MIERWVAFWDRREPPASLALTRILVALVVLADLLIGAYEGAVPALWVRSPLGMAAVAEAEPHTLAALRFDGSQEIAVVLWAVAVCAASMLFLGALHHVAGVILTLALVGLTRLQPTGDGIDRLLAIVVPILALSSASACCSVDAWLRHKLGRPKLESVPAWPRYLLLLQLVWVYFSSAVSRDDLAWWPQGSFSAISNVLEDPHFARFSARGLARLFPLTQAATFMTMAFELSAPLMVVWAFGDLECHSGLPRLAHRLRRVWLTVGISLHLGIALTMQIGIFPFGMLALYPIFFHPDELSTARRAFVAWLRPTKTADGSSGWI